VRVPNVYTMKETDRIADLIHIAGGAAVNSVGVEIADLSHVNLAEQLQDGERVNIPFKILTTPTAIPSATPLAGGCPSATPIATGTTNTIKVYVTGAVCKPGIYALPATARVSDAIAAAGGPSLDADLTRINLAAFVADGQQVAVPSKASSNNATTGAAPTQAVTSDSSSSADSAGSSTSSGTGSKSSSPPSSASKGKATPLGKVNINTASAEELSKYLPGIGPTYAQRIVDYRKQHGPFQRIEDLMKVKGIGKTLFAKLKDMITV
jgi:competence protein ComEA